MEVCLGVFTSAEFRKLMRKGYSEKDSDDAT